MLLPLQDAIAKISAKTPIGTTLRSAELAQLPLALRERAQFSAAVTSVRLMQTVQDRILGQVNLARERLSDGKTAMFDRSSFIDAIRSTAEQEGVETIEKDSERGTLKDIRSIPRLGLIYDMQNAQANGYARWKLDQTEGALLLYPAWEFTRVESRKRPRDDWERRWAEAGGSLTDGRMVALKTDPVWRQLSVFGTPWPPFDWGSGMGLEEIDYDEAVQLGLLKDGELPAPTGEPDFNAALSASTEGLSPAFRQVLAEVFGPQIQLDGEEISWQEDQGTAYEQTRTQQQAAARQLAARGRGLAQAIRWGNGPPDVVEENQRFAERAWLAEITSVANGRKPLFHESIGESAAPMADYLRPLLPEGVVIRVEGGEIFAWRPDVMRSAFKDIRQHSDDGRWLGYGLDVFGEQTARTHVQILGPDDSVVWAFWAPRDTAPIFGRARTQDYLDAHGPGYRYVLVEPPRPRQ